MAEFIYKENYYIGIVESMAAGLIMIATKSGGPLTDIIETSVGSQTGFLASSAIEYAQCIRYILSLSDDEKELIRSAARYV